MASIASLTAVIHNRFFDGRLKIPAVSNPVQNITQSSFMLFYTNVNTVLAAGTTVEDGFYSTTVQLACRHDTYDKARSLSFNAFEYLNANKRTLAGVWWIPGEPPTFLGVDGQAGNVWAFEVRMVGDN